MVYSSILLVEILWCESIQLDFIGAGRSQELLYFLTFVRSLNKFNANIWCANIIKKLIEVSETSKSNDSNCFISVRNIHEILSNISKSVHFKSCDFLTNFSPWKPPMLLWIVTV